MELLILLVLLLALDLALSRWGHDSRDGHDSSPDEAGDASRRGGLMLAAVGRLLSGGAVWVLAGTPLAVVVVAGALGGGVFDRLSGGGLSAPDAESSRARDQLERVFGASDPNLVLLVTATRDSVEDPATAAVGTTLTRQLVVGGPYRYVRNPMYLAVTAAILGQALALGRPGLLR
jgi:Phospholipid methyltransferase